MKRAAKVRAAARGKWYGLLGVWTILFNGLHDEGWTHSAGWRWEGAIGWTNLLRDAGRPAGRVLTTMPMRMPKIRHVVESTGRIHNSRCQVVLRRRWNIDGRGRTNRLDHHISVSNGAEPVFLLARFHRNFDG